MCFLMFYGKSTTGYEYKKNRDWNPGIPGLEKGRDFNPGIQNRSGLTPLV
jgi:hypothetical protein